MGTTLGLIGLLVGAALALEGLDAVTGGEVYLASVRQLAEATGTETQHETTTASVTPTPAPTTEPSPVPAPAGIQTQPPPPPTAPSTEQPQTQPPPTVEPPKPALPPPSLPQPPMSVMPKEGLHQPGIFPSEEEPGGDRDFVDPREIQQVLREIRDMRSQIKQLTSQLKKNPAFAEDLAKINAAGAELGQFNTAIRNAVNSGGSVREVIQEFRDNQYWDLFNAIRTKVQLPQEIKQIETTLRRLDRTIKVKSVQSIGLNIGSLETKIAEMKNQIAAVKSAIASGNIEEAQEAIQFFHEGGHPGEIEGTIYRIRDIKQMLKRVRDEQIRSEVDKVLQEVVDAFNAGEYRDARETMDEYADDLQRLIQRFFAAQMLRGRNRTESFSKIRNLDALIRSKLEESDQRQPQQGQQP